MEIVHECEEMQMKDTERKVAELTQTPSICPPETKRSQMFKSPKEFEKIDHHVFDVRPMF
jgi:hypothetical protein